MSQYKKHINNLHNQIDGLKYFQEERLKMLMIGVDLQIINRELNELKGFDANIDLASDLTSKAKEIYDTMFTRYELAIIQLDIIRNESLSLCQYTRDLEKQLEALNEI